MIQNNVLQIKIKVEINKSRVTMTFYRCQGKLIVRNKDKTHTLDQDVSAKMHVMKKKILCMGFKLVQQNKCILLISFCPVFFEYLHTSLHE